MLSTYLAAQTPVAIILQNKICVSGTIKAFDSYVIVVEGQKREIVYRHAVSSLAASLHEEPKKAAVAYKSAPTKIANRSGQTSGRKNRPPQTQRVLPPSTDETSINNGMKEGLLKWMQEQKAAK